MDRPLQDISINPEKFPLWLPANSTCEVKKDKSLYLSQHNTVTCLVIAERD